MRRFFPRRGRGRQSFRLAHRRWFCADSHGDELTRYGGIAHCASGRASVVLVEPGFTRRSPIPFHRAARVGDWRIRLVAVVPDATAAIMAEDATNSPPAHGYRFFMARVRVTYRGDRSNVFEMSMLGAVGRSAVGYDTGCELNTLPDELPYDELFPGGTATGNVCWEVRRSDVESLVMHAGADPYLEDTQRVYFALAP